MSSQKRPASPLRHVSNGDQAESSTKRGRANDEQSKAQPPSLHAWLHPDELPPLRTSSPPLHYSSSTFLSFSLSFVAPAHVNTESAIAKEARRMVKELNVPDLVGDEVMRGDEGAFGYGEGRVVSSKGKERAREPDHRMWAVRALCLKDGRNGTKGEGDYQLIETYNDDGEKYGGERLLRVLQEERAVDTLTVCCRWYGGDLIGPVRFQHIGFTAKTSLQQLLRLTRVRDLRQGLEALDEAIAELRETINGPAEPPDSVNSLGKGATEGKEGSKYDDIADVVKLERLLKAKEKTRKTLEDKVGWAGMESARNEVSAR